MVDDFFIAVDEVQLRIRKIKMAATPKRTSLIFLHDALGSIPQWRAFPSLLSSALQRDAILIERRGHGASDPLPSTRTANYLHREALEVLPKVLAKLDIEKPILIGHSDGGTIGLLYAAHFPAEVIVTIAAHTFVENITLQGIRAAVIQKAILVSKLEKYHGAKTETLFDAWSNTWLAEDFLNWDIRGVLPGINCPVLAIQSKDDPYGSLAQVDSIFSPTNGQSFLLEEAGHQPHLKASETVIAAIQSFLFQLPM